MKNLCRSKGGSCKCLQKSTWGRGVSKSPKTRLRSLWMAPIINSEKINIDRHDYQENFSSRHEFSKKKNSI